MSDISHYYKFRTQVNVLANMEGVVTARRLSDTILEIGKLAFDSLNEELELYREFTMLPHISPLFEKYLEANQGFCRCSQCTEPDPHLA